MFVVQLGQKPKLTQVCRPICSKTSMLILLRKSETLSLSSFNTQNSVAAWDDSKLKLFDPT